MNVLMPQLGETVAEGTVANWHKNVGDLVEADEILLDVETDKVSMEIPAPRSGVLVEIRVPAGETVDVGTVLAIIRAEGEAAEAVDTAAEADIAAADESGGPAAEPANDATVIEPTVKTPRPALAAMNGNTRLSPAVRRLVAEHQLDVGAIPGSGRNGRITRRDVLEFIEQDEAQPRTVRIPRPSELPAETSEPSAAPSAERAAAPAPGGTAEHRAAVPERPAERAATPPPPSAPAPVAASTPSETPTFAGGRVPFNRIRRLTAEHMVKSKTTSPHVLQAVEVNFAGVDRVRTALRDSWRSEHGFSLTYLPFIAHAVCRALAEFPHANASIEGNELVLHEHVNLAIAVDLGPAGLLAPVIHEAERMSVTELARAIQDLAGRARGNKLTPDDLTGGTYTLSNSGTFGTLITAPIINQPQVAILSTDGVRKKPVVIEGPDGDSIGIRPIGILAQSFDHRAIDGAYSAAFLDRVRKLLETHNWFREL